MAFTATIHRRSELGASLAIRVRCADGAWTGPPGQFYLLRTADAWSPYLRRALFPSFIDPNEWVDAPLMASGSVHCLDDALAQLAAGARAAQINAAVWVDRALPARIVPALAGRQADQ